MRAVDKYDLEGKFLMRFNSVTEAELYEGFNGSHLIQALQFNGLYHGHYWQYANVQREIRNPSYTDQQTAEFNQLIATHRNIINSALWKNPFYLKGCQDDRNEMYQVVLIHIWLSFGKYDRYQTSFSTWIYTITDNAAKQYYSRIVKKYQEAYTMQDDFSWYSGATYDEYSEETIATLQEAMKCLCGDHKKAVDIYMKGQGLVQKSKEDGHYGGYYSTKFIEAKRTIAEKVNCLAEEYGFVTRRRVITDQPQRRNNSLSKPIIQMDLTGQEVKIWPSIQEAVRAGFNNESIREVNNGKKKHHKGFLWKYKGNKDFKIPDQPISRGRPIYQISLDGKTILKHETVKAAVLAINGRYSNLVRAATNNAISLGFRWTFDIP